MSHGIDACRAFRSRLERALDARGDTSLTELGWHEHLGRCDACRGLLEAEEALEFLLASLPEPRLPDDLTERVLATLRRARSDERLDHLLELDSPAAVPSGLAQSVLQERRFDRLLEVAGEVAPPAGLEQRVLAAVQAARAVEMGTRGQVLPFSRRVWAAAAGVFLLAAAGLLVARSTVFEAEPPEGLLAALDVLENWELITASEDLALRTGIHFEATDEALLDYLEDR